MPSYAIQRIVYPRLFSLESRPQLGNRSDSYRLSCFMMVQVVTLLRPKPTPRRLQRFASRVMVIDVAARPSSQKAAVLQSKCLSTSRCTTSIGEDPCHQRRTRLSHACLTTTAAPTSTCRRMQQVASPSVHSCRRCPLPLPVARTMSTYKRD